MKKVILPRLRICVLGAVNGALYSVLVALIVWQLDAWADRRINAEDAYGNQVSATSLGSSVRWTGIVMIWVLAFTLAAALVDHVWPHHRKRSVLFWEVVGVFAIAAWNAFVLCGSLLNRHFPEDVTALAWVGSVSKLNDPISFGIVHVMTGNWVQLLNPVFGPINFVIVIVVNFAYGHLVRALQPKTQ